MKIGIISSFYYPTQIGGAERSVQLLAETMRQKGHAVTVLVTSTNGRREENIINGVPVVYIPQKNIYTWPPASSNPLKRSLWHAWDSYNVGMKKSVAEWLQQTKPDIVHTNTMVGMSPLIWQAVRERGIGLVHTLRDYYLMCPKTTMFSHNTNCQSSCIGCLPYALPRKRLSSLPSAVVGISRFVLERHLQAGYFESVPIREVIFNSCPVSPDAQETSSYAGLPRIGFIGRIDASKGIELFLKECHGLPNPIIIAGEGDTSYVDQLKATYDRPNIHWMGRMNSADFFRSIDINAVPVLWHEPFGRVIGEAYGHGIPVIVSSRGGIPELVENGKTGIFFDPEEEGSLHSLLEKLTLQQCRGMKKACLEKVLEFDPELIAKSYEALYARVLASTD